LEKLALEFYQASEITHQGLERLNQSLRRLTLLTSIKFDFYSSGQVEAKYDPCVLLKGLKDLKAVSLNFRYSEIINRVLQNLGQGLKDLVFLQYISLHFCDFVNIDDTDVCYLSQAFKKLRNLEDVELHFAGYRKMTDEALDSLAHSIKELGCLKVITLSFDDCLLIRSHCQERIQADLKSLDSKPIFNISVRFEEVEWIF